MDTVITNKKYPFYLWLLSIVVAPILLVIIGMINLPDEIGASDTDVSGSLFVFLLFVVFGLLYSLPTFLMAFFSFKLLQQKFHHPMLLKLFIGVISIIGVFITFLLISGWNAFQWNGNRSGIVYTLVYATSIILTSLFLKVTKSTKQSL